MHHMRNIKIIGIEYTLWLYITACLSWLCLRMWDISISGYIILLFPLLISVLLLKAKGNLGSLVVQPEKGGKFWKYELGLGVLISMVMAWIIVEVKPVAFFTGAPNTQSILSGIFNPNPKEMVPMLAALMETIYLALLATVFAIPFAFVLSFFAAKNLMFGSWMGRAAYVFIRTVSTIFRSIEAIVWAIIFCVWVGIGPFAGMLALWIHSIAALIKLYSEQIENIDPGPVEAIKATGASTLQVWRYAVAPQILAPYLAFTIYRWDINVRMATIVGFVGGGGIGLALYQQQQMLAWRNVGLIMWLIALVVWMMDMFSGYIRSRLITN
ncbi:MAG: phosphonate ABC transporter, permease protein PhnE [Candidatus Cloacimonetes bacterium]|nr:phosphonate ABC transporter, permease protein PhnE [Candidatus Cloacimonadota bacterium]